MYYTSPQTEKAFLNYMDVYHDTYDKKLAPKDLMEVSQLLGTFFNIYLETNFFL
jgi:hypothetical protein